MCAVKAPYIPPMRNTSRPLDTSPEAAAIQVAAYRGMSGEQRVRLALEASEFLLDVARARVHSQHPEYSDSAVSRALTSAWYPQVNMSGRGP